MTAQHRPHLALIGLMGAGKSTVGAALAAQGNRRHIDLDRWIQNDTGRSIGVLFAEGGEEAFRQAETDTLQRVLQIEQPLVLSTGGGVLTRAENQQVLKERTHVVWLRATPETLAQRVGDGTGRPLLAQGDPLTVLQELDRQRRSAYQAAAEAIIDTDDRTLKAIVEEIMALDLTGASQ